jgi:hypothetical protein
MVKLRRFQTFVLAVILTAGLGLCVPAAYADFNVTWSLRPNDPICPYRSGCYEQVHTVTLVKGTTYVIDMKSTQIDSYLYLEDSGAKMLAQDDDSGGNLNARIVWTAQYTGTHRLVATSFGQGQTGTYTISVAPK